MSGVALPGGGTLYGVHAEPPPKTVPRGTGLVPLTGREFSDEFSDEFA